MTNDSKTKHKATSGTASATISDHADFDSFTGSRFTFELDDQLNRWKILAISESNVNHQHQVITLWLPNDGDVINRKYEVVEVFAAPGKANASWTEATGSTYRPYTAIKGSVTVTLNNSYQTAELTFHFEGISGTKKVTVTEGNMTLKGFSEELKPRVAGAVTCDLSDSVTAHYESTAAELYTLPEQSSFPAHIVAWSQQLAPRPNPIDYRLTLNIAKGVLPGTYTFGPDSREVRAVFFDIRQNLSWPSESGTITLQSIPNFETLEGRLSADFDFAGTATLIDGSVLRLQAKNGNLNVEK
jgi:hypothetical protein